MAVVQISRIQARRGLQQDLPQLASGELGWSVDQRRLFIGNGTIVEGAPSEGVTEILTAYTDLSAVLKTYIFRGNAGGYTTQTGSSLLSPTVRSFQDKLDDIVSVKDFGAVGDGVTDDTAAINRAIQQIYYITRLQNYPQVRRTIYFPAGTYIVSGATIAVPPYARFVGDGIQSSIIKQTDNTQTCAIQFCDSQFQTGATLGQNSAVLPTSIVFENMSFWNNNDKDVVQIDSATHITFINCQFLGSLISPTVPGSTPYAGIRIKSFATTTRSINFISCRFENTRYAVISDEASSDVRLSQCMLAGLYKGFKLGQNSVNAATSPNNYKIMNTTFASVANNAIDAYTYVSGIMSLGNHYIDVGNNFAGSGSPVAPILSWLADGNMSIGDSFDRNDTDNAVQPRISFNNSRTISVQPNVGFVAGSYVTGISGVAVLLDNQSSFITSNVTLANSCSVNYTVTRGTAFRQGTMLFSNDQSQLNFQSFVDNFTGSGNTGVNFFINNNNVITYTTSSTGSNAILKYNINYFN